MARTITLVLALMLLAAAGAWIGAGTQEWYSHARLGTHPVPVVAVAISKDGRYAASLDAAGELRCWDLQQHRLLHRTVLPVGGRLKPGEATVAISPDGQVLAVTAPPMGTQVWRPTGSSERVDVPVQAMWSPLLALSHDNTLLATMDEQGALHVWDARTAEHVAEPDDNPLDWPEAVSHLLFSDEDKAVGYLRVGELVPDFFALDTGNRLFGDVGGQHIRSRDPEGTRYLRVDHWQTKHDMDQWQSHDNLGPEYNASDRLAVRYRDNTTPPGTTITATGVA